jgi:GYF domain 2
VTVNADWFYSAGETRQGPVTELELRRLARDGKLKPSDLVWKDGMPDWVEARTVDSLFPRRAEAEPDPDERPSRRRYEDDRPTRRVRNEYDDDRPGRGRDDDDDDRPRIRRTAADVDDEDDYDRPRRRTSEKPGQIQAVAIMMMVGGIFAIIVFLSYAATCFGLVWPGIYFELVVGIMAIVRAANMLGRDDQGPPKTLAILQIICIINLDIINCVLGIVSLVMLNDPQVQSYYRRKGFA